MKLYLLPFLLLFIINNFLLGQDKNVFAIYDIRISEKYKKEFISLAYVQDGNPKKDHYLKKSKIQKTTGWVLLGGGVAMGVARTLLYNATVDDESTVSNGGVVLTIVGVASAIVSVPFFVRSSKNKKLAANISIKRQKILLPIQDILIVRNQPTVSLSFSLR